jgi:hypothetical protein
VRVKRDPLQETGSETSCELRKEKIMSKSTGQKPEGKTSRIKVGKLPQQEKELKDPEAENVKGGGGPSGGVLRSQGEEIPQTKQN